MNCNISPITIGRSLGKASGSVMFWCHETIRVQLRLALGGLKIAIEIHKYATYKITCIVITHKCSLVGNTNINWGEMACFHCTTMPNAQLKLSAPKYEFVIRT